MSSCACTFVYTAKAFSTWPSIWHWRASAYRIMFCMQLVGSPGPYQYACKEHSISLNKNCLLQDMEGISAGLKRRRKSQVAHPHKVYALQDVQAAACRLYTDAEGNAEVLLQWIRQVNLLPWLVVLVVSLARWSFTLNRRIILAPPPPALALCECTCYAMDVL